MKIWVSLEAGIDERLVDWAAANCPSRQRAANPNNDVNANMAEGDGVLYRTPLKQHFICDSNSI